MTLRLILGAALLLTAAPAARAHLVPREAHDRTVVVHVLPDPAGVKVRVDYRLEVTEWTIFNVDLKPYEGELDPFDYRGKQLEFHAKFAQLYAPAIADRLHAKANGKRIDFTPVRQTPTLRDEKGELLGHVRFDFVFEASFPSAAENDFELREQCYLGEKGTIDLSIVPADSLRVLSKTQPDEELKKRATLDQRPGDDTKLREVRLRFTMPTASPPPPVEPPAPPAPQPTAPPHDDGFSLRGLLFHTDYGFWLTMLMALIFGAAHALTPGHGKTLVAAYLVGERGTVWHAMFLGTVTTATHTGMVLGIALALFVLPDEWGEWFKTLLQNGLGLAMGLMVACMGAWLLLQRLSGRADHFHVGGGHHHHHHEPARSGAVTWWGLIVLGVTGGLVPCWDAIYLLLYTVGRSQFLIALPAVIAFSAGLAGVLVLIGVLVVQVPRFARSRLGEGRVVRALPIVSAVVVMLMGIWLAYEGVQGHQ